MVGFICFVLSSQSYLSEGEKKDSFASSLFLYEKENIEIVLAGVQDVYKRQREVCLLKQIKKKLPKRIYWNIMNFLSIMMK